MVAPGVGEYDAPRGYRLFFCPACTVTRSGYCLWYNKTTNKLVVVRRRIEWANGRVSGGNLYKTVQLAATQVQDKRGDMHEHNDCKHDLKHCAKCNVAYCAKCGKEWGERQHYYPQRPYWITWWDSGTTDAIDQATLTCSHN